MKKLIILLILILPGLLTFSQGYSLFTAEVPAFYNADSRYELGTQFKILNDGVITKARMYSSVYESGVHVVRIWKKTSTSNELVFGPIDWNITSGVTGWQEYTLNTPVNVQKNSTYVISISNSTDKIYAQSVNFSPVVNNSSLEYQGGFYSVNLGQIPLSQWGGSSYFRDVVFQVTVPDTVVVPPIDTTIVPPVDTTVIPPVDTTVIPPVNISFSNKALVIVNSSSLYYSEFTKYIKPYLDNFGVPYDLWDNSQQGQIPDFKGYALLVFGHNRVYETGYPFTKLDSAVYNGSGLLSFDNHLFEFNNQFSSLISGQSIQANVIRINNTTHYITSLHNPDTYSPNNNVINLLSNWSIRQTNTLKNANVLAQISSGSVNIPLLEIANYGQGRIVKWAGYNWMFESVLGPVYGMDDLLWKGMVWAARKPFALVGMPPIITMRVDDVDGYGYTDLSQLEWARICISYGFKPWIGTFNNNLSPLVVSKLKSFIDSGNATAGPHAFTSGDLIYFYNYGVSSYNVVNNCYLAKKFYDDNKLKISSFLACHYYELSSVAAPVLAEMGIKFLGMVYPPDYSYYQFPNSIAAGPYRLNGRTRIHSEVRPLYYGDYITVGGVNFFNCFTEIRDDAGYDWTPNNNVSETIGKGVRQLRRALNSMVLPTLFGHEYHFDVINSVNWTSIMSGISSSIAEYKPTFLTMDDAVKYVRAKTNLLITNVVSNSSNVEITYSANNDSDIKCYLFDEQNNSINYQFVVLPKYNGVNKVVVNK